MTLRPERCIVGTGTDDPGTGQFTQQDPIGIAGGANMCGFAGGDRHAAWHAATRSVGSARIESDRLSRHVGVGLSPSALSTTIVQAFDADETQALVRTLMLHNWDTSAVARELGVTRKTVYARMKRLRVPTRRNTTPANGEDSRASLIGSVAARGTTTQE